jgi:hypothetical protein
MLSELPAPAVCLTDAAVERTATRPRWLGVALGGTVALLVAGAHLLQTLHAARELQVEIAIASPASFQQETPRVAHLLARRASGAFEDIEARSYASAFLDSRTTFRFSVADPAATNFLFSPGQGEALLAIRSAAVGGTAVPLAAFEAVQQVKVLDLTAERLLLKTTGGERAPLIRFSIPSPLPVAKAPLGRAVLEAAVLFVLVAGIAVALIQGSSLTRNVSLRAALPFVAAGGLILCMALLSRFNAHPDEYLHFESARYFTAHTVPPALDDPAVAPSFGHYGVSYLQSFDTSYFLMGKFMAALAWLHSPEIAARLFNVTLFIVVAAYAGMRLRGSVAAAILLISPQIWYVFSYVNGDAWALAVALIAIVQLATDDSLLNEYLRADSWRKSAHGGLAFAGLLALLLMAKRNYYLFLPFVGLVGIWKTFVWSNGAPRKQLLSRWAAIALAALALYLPGRIAHAAINRFELPRLVAEQAEKFAAPGFRPSEIAAGSGTRRLNMRSHGVPFSEVFTKHRWAAASFQSFCGVYHWMTLRSPAPYYFFIGGLYLAVLSTIAFAFRNLPRQEALFGALTVCAAAAVILLSAYHSWTADFQPQGRYLFPILPMLAFVLHRYRETLRSRALHLLFAGMFAASVFSFVFTGLRAIPQ